MRRLIFALGVFVGLTVLLSAGLGEASIAPTLARTAGAQPGGSRTAPTANSPASPFVHSQAGPAVTDVCTYAVSQGTGTLVPGTSDIGNHCFIACTTTIDLPFSYQLYDMTFSSANVGSTGNLQFLSNSARTQSTCLPATLDFEYTIFAHSGSLVTDCFKCGVFTSTSGTAPNRIFNIEWRAAFFEGPPVNFEVRLYEGQTQFDIVYGAVPFGGFDAVVGVQKHVVTGPYTQYECNTGGTLSEGLVLTFTPAECVTPTSTPAPSPTPCQGRVNICHRTSAARNQYVQIEIDCQALPAHLAHGDLYPVPEGGCPTGVPGPGPGPRSSGP